MTMAEELKRRLCIRKIQYYCGTEDTIFDEQVLHEKLEVGNMKKKRKPGKKWSDAAAHNYSDFNPSTETSSPILNIPRYTLQGT
jgi:hypothetical protein